MIHALILAGLHSRIRLPDKLTASVSILWLTPTVPTVPTAREQPQPTVSRSQPRKPVVPSARPASASTSNFDHPTQSEPVSEPPTPTANATPTAPLHLDFDALRAQAVEQELTRKKSPVEALNESRQKNQSLEAKVEDGANQAQRPDCRTAHAGAGLFAPLMIAADLARDKGCKF